MFFKRGTAHRNVRVTEAATAREVCKTVNEALHSRALSEYHCESVSWDDASRATNARGLTASGANITDTRLWAKDGSLLFTVRSDKWNETLGVVSASDVALLVGNHVPNNGTAAVELKPSTLHTFLKNIGTYGSYAGLAPDASFIAETLDSEVLIRFQTVFLPVESSEDAAVEFVTESRNYQTKKADEPRNLLLLCTTQGTAVRADTPGVQRLFHHGVDKHGTVHEFWLEAERSAHAVGLAQAETEEEAAEAAARGKATSALIGIRAMGTRFNTLMTVQVPLKRQVIPPLGLVPPVTPGVLPGLSTLHPVQQMVSYPEKYSADHPEDYPQAVATTPPVPAILYCLVGRWADVTVLCERGSGDGVRDWALDALSRIPQGLSEGRWTVVLDPTKPSRSCNVLRSQGYVFLVVAAETAPPGDTLKFAFGFLSKMRDDFLLAVRDFREAAQGGGAGILQGLHGPQLKNVLDRFRTHPVEFSGHQIRMQNQLQVFADSQQPDFSDPMKRANIFLDDELGRIGHIDHIIERSDHLTLNRDLFYKPKDSSFLSQLIGPSARQSWKGSVEKDPPKRPARNIFGPLKGEANAARVSLGTNQGPAPQLRFKEPPERDQLQHVTITCILFYTVAGGVPTVDAVAAAVADVEALYAGCARAGKLADEEMDFAKGRIPEPFRPGGSIIVDGDAFPT